MPNRRTFNEPSVPPAGRWRRSTSWQQAASWPSSRTSFCPWPRRVARRPRQRSGSWRSGSGSSARRSSGRSSGSSGWPRRPTPETEPPDAPDARPARSGRRRPPDPAPRQDPLGWAGLWHDHDMRPVVIAANWKMNTTPSDAGELAVTIAGRTRVDGVSRVICPPFVALAAVRDALASTDPDVAVGAQDVHHELAGAYTGDISAPMLVGLADWVIVGHSERRRDHGETDDRIGRKLVRAVEAGLRPILCVGEQLTDRDAGRATSIVDAQIAGDLADHE